MQTNIFIVKYKKRVLWVGSPISQLPPQLLKEGPLDTIDIVRTDEEEVAAVVESLAACYKPIFNEPEETWPADIRLFCTDKPYRTSHMRECRRKKLFKYNSNYLSWRQIET